LAESVHSSSSEDDVRSAFLAIAFVVSLTTTAWAQSGSDPLPPQSEPGERSPRRLNADAFILKAGIVYGIF